jgi:hypothetical protein
MPKAPIKSCDEYRQDVIERFTKLYPKSELYSETFGEWLLQEHGMLLERYNLFRSLASRKE